MNYFAGLEMSKRALNVFRMGMQVAGHNVANVNTPGYSRQRVELSTTDPYTDPGVSSPVIPGQIGTGVKADEIIRIRDEFLDFQYRSELADAGYWDKINQMYETVQLYISEPQSAGIKAGFDTFWNALSNLQKNPETPALREAVIEAANSLGAQIDTLVKGYDEYASAINSEVKSIVDQTNSLLYQVAALNEEIYQVEAMNQNPNDLLDKRDLLLDQLTEMLEVDIQEPFTNGDVTGEFFLTLNGRTLVQGSRVREVVAHAFQWENQTYYDVQVRDNEFDIVENTGVTLALATGPEGVHQLNVYRIANGEEWAIGNEDALCLNPNGSVKTIWTNTFENGIIASETASTAGEEQTFTVSSGDYDVEFSLKWDGTTWNLSAEVSDNSEEPPTLIDNIGPLSISANPDLTVDDLAAGMQSIFNEALNETTPDPDDVVPLPVSVSADDNTLTITSDVNSVQIEDANNVLSMTRSTVSMRTRPMSTTEALHLSTSFRIQVGTQGTRVASKIFSNSTNPDLAAGDILAEGNAGDTYTFRVGAGEYQADVTVTWNDDADRWVMTSDVFSEIDGFKSPNHPSSYPVTSTAATGHLTVNDLSSFLKDVLKTSDTEHAFTVYTGKSDNGPELTRFSIASDNNYLISITDVVGDLAAQMQMSNPNEPVTIDVADTDSLETIRNKINEKYHEAYGLTSPEQWVHASLEQDSDQSWYLVIKANVAGEAQRVVLMGDESGDMQTLRRLGLVKEEQIGTDAKGSPIYREVTGYSQVAEDASFSFNGVQFLSSDNKFNEARRIPSGTNRSDYSAKTLEEVSEGIWLDLQGVGHTAITVRHHVRGGSVKALEDIRDGLIPNLKAGLEDVVWGMVNSFNAYHYSGYGVGGSINTTGVAFFDPLRHKSGSASLLNVSQAVKDDESLLSAATGKLDESGKPASGETAGLGNGNNASRMVSLKTAKLLSNGSASLGEFYEAYLAQIGSEAGRAALMSKAQSNLVSQINTQRQAVMGVNVDEEMLDILKFNHAYNAMARYATTIDEMLDRLINGFGVVGR